MCSSDLEDVRPCFRALKELSKKVLGRIDNSHTTPVLSMGMTNDFEVAIEEGSNMVRIGRAIFA